LIETSLKHVHVDRDFVAAHFSVDVRPQADCRENHSDVILHTITVLNSLWGVHLKSVVIEYTLDTANLGLCPNRAATECSAHKVQGFTKQIPEVPQDYWKGKQKQIQVRVCVPSSCRKVPKIPLEVGGGVKHLTPPAPSKWPDFRSGSVATPL